jgi:hypothetical protein
MAIMTTDEACFKEMQAFRNDHLALVVYVVDNSGEAVFTAIRDYKNVWSHASVKVGDLAEYSLILDYAEVKRLVAEAKTLEAKTLEVRRERGDKTP